MIRFNETIAKNNKRAVLLPNLVWLLGQLVGFSAALFALSHRKIPAALTPFGYRPDRISSELDCITKSICSRSSQLFCGVNAKINLQLLCDSPFIRI